MAVTGHLGHNLTKVMTWQVGRSARTTVVATQGSPTLRDNIVTVFGSRVADGLEQLTVEGPSGASISGHAPRCQLCMVSHAPPLAPCDAVHLARRYVSKATAGSSKSAGDRLFFFLNSRPIDLPKVRKLRHTQQPTGCISPALYSRCHTFTHFLAGQPGCDRHVSLAVECCHSALPPCCHPGPEAPAAQARAVTAHASPCRRKPNLFHQQ